MTPAPSQLLQLLQLLSHAATPVPAHPHRDQAPRPATQGCLLPLQEVAGEMVVEELAPVVTVEADNGEQSGLIGVACTFISALLHSDVFSGFVAYHLHPSCIQGVIFCESTNPFRPRPIERFGVI